jgi:DNA-directed RNA polymerase subunit K/omega
MTPEQKQHAEKANRLVESGAHDIDNTKRGFSEVAAEKLTIANREREAAGLIKGKFQK